MLGSPSLLPGTSRRVSRPRAVCASTERRGSTRSRLLPSAQPLGSRRPSQPAPRRSAAASAACSAAAAAAAPLSVLSRRSLLAEVDACAVCDAPGPPGCIVSPAGSPLRALSAGDRQTRRRAVRTGRQAGRQADRQAGKQRGGRASRCMARPAHPTLRVLTGSRSCREFHRHRCPRQVRAGGVLLWLPHLTPSAGGACRRRRGCPAPNRPQTVGQIRGQPEG